MNKLKQLEERISLLAIAEIEYANSYYTDLLIDASVKKINLQSEISWLSDKLRLAANKRLLDSFKTL